MKEAWLYYDYLRRWGLFLLLGLVLGAITGFGYSLQHDDPLQFKATATLNLTARIQIRVISDFNPTVKSAVESLLDTAYMLERVYIHAPVRIHSINMERFGGTLWWKATILGSIVGGLLISAGAYVWDDVRKYQRERHRLESTDN